MVKPDPHPVFSHPTNFDIPIWRYMDFAKFVSFLSSSSLFFVKASYLNDKFEGSITRPSKIIEEEWIKNLEKQNATDFDPDRIRTQLHQIRQMFRDTSYVNCWHMSEHESVAMWKVYSQTNESICIQATYRKLHDALPDFCRIGCVNYVDFEKSIIPLDNALWPLMHKRMSFEHEREVRALIWTMDSKFPSEWEGNRTEHGIYINVDISMLVENIYVNPDCQRWFSELCGR